MRVLAYTSPARGDLYPVVPILADVIARGGEACLYTLAEELENVRTAGIASYAIDPAIERDQLRDWRSSSQLARTISVLRTFLRRAAYEVPDVTQAIARHDPDALLVDINCWGAAIAAEASGLPWSIYSPYLAPVPSRQAPPYGIGLAPMGGPLGAARDAVLRGLALGLFEKPVMAPINRLRAQYGLSKLSRYSALLARPELLLMLTAEGFEYPRDDWPTNARLVGPIDWAPPEPEPAWLDEVQDPVVLVTCSTEHQSDRALIDTALKALPAAGFSVIATSAAHDPGTFDPPSGSRVVHFVAHEPILRRAACVVCHGGMGITQKALAAGVPVVVVPFGRDQYETARRVEVAAAGVRLTPRRLTPERLAHAVRGAIDHRKGAQQISCAFADAGGASAAVDALEQIAGRRPVEKGTPVRACGASE
ncbi:MAG TPA: nucleotide disphospho-sugar-binding domain-containing protein [Solirubrobacteraceae bacterium]